jgi:hypothetical protein
MTMPDTLPKFAILDPRDDCPHDPGTDPTFQESSLFCWHDLDRGFGGFWRLGQEPNVGALNSCFGVFTQDGLRFRSNVTGVPMAAADRGSTHMGWGPQLRVDLDSLSIHADFPDLQASLRFADFFPRYDWYDLLDRPRHHSNHFENAGRVQGRIRIGGEEIEIDGLGYRDRSWGGRVWRGMRGTRWWPSVFGPDLTMFLSASVHESGGHGSYGYMIRDGVPQTLRKVDIGAMLDSDAISPRAGVGRFLMANGQFGEVRQERTDGILLHVRGYSAVESIGIATFEGRRGMSNLEVCTNPLGGYELPIITIGANSGDGLSRR